MISNLPKDLWGLVQTRQQIDPSDLTVAMEQQVSSGDLDYRTRVLIRDSAKALKNYWGRKRFAAWLARSRFGKDIDLICQGPWDDDRGFASLERRVMDVTRPETVRQFLNDLGNKIRKPLRIEIRGSIALIMLGLLSRKTEDVDVVDEVPAELRSQHELLHHLKEVHFLEL